MSAYGEDVSLFGDAAPAPAKLYRVTVTDYVTEETVTYEIAAANGDEAFDEASRRIDPTGKHTVGGSFHRSEGDWGLR